MSATSGTAETSIPLLAWRQRVTQTVGVVPVARLLEGAALFASVDDAAAARLLFQSAAIREGFSPQLIRGRAELATAIGVHIRSPEGIAAPTTSTIDIALAELGRIAPLVARPEAGSGGPAITDAAMVVDGLYRWLSDEQDAPPPSAATIAGVLAMPRIDPGRLTGAPSLLLATGLAVASLRTFFDQVHDLLFAPMGSGGLLKATAALHVAGLGPYLTNLPKLVRKSRDVFELARVVMGAVGVDASIPIPEWVAFLAQQARGGLMTEIIDELGDLGAMNGLAKILLRITRMADGLVDAGQVRRVRDAAIDNGDFGLAARAQTQLLRLTPGDREEALVLARIYGTDGKIAAAEDVLTRLLDTDVTDVIAANHLAALRSRNFEAYAIQQGFLTPPDRAWKRRSGTAIKAGAAPAIGRRLAPVEFVG